MKHNIDDTTIQAAIDEACEETRKAYPMALGQLAIDKNQFPSTWIGETSSRLTLARAFLARLPEPTPPVVDGKTPGQVAFFTLNPHGDWAKLLSGDKALYEDAASAVLAAFGGTSLESAIARMEAVDVWSVYKHYPSPFSEEALGGVRAHLIAAARGPINLEAAVGASPGSFARTCDDPTTGELPMSEIPWIEWHGGDCPLKDEEVEKWQYKTSDGILITHPCANPSDYIWQVPGDDIAAYRVLKWRKGCGTSSLITEHKPLTAEQWAERWQTEADARNAQFKELKKAEAELGKVTRERDDLNFVLKGQEPWNQKAQAYLDGGRWAGSCYIEGVMTELEERDAELADLRKDNAHLRAACDIFQDGLSRLRPISEAGPVPAGCLRVLAWLDNTGGESCWIYGWQEWDGDNHYADILLPEASQPTVEAQQVAKPEPETFEAHGQVWTRHAPGDPMPCDENRSVEIITQKAIDEKDWFSAPRDSSYWQWDHNTKIIGWRYADEPTPDPEPTPTWQPKVGDVVMLKSSGPKMTVCQIQDTVCKCQWFKDDVADVECFEIATLQPA